jgi:hypothetical protein
MAHTQLTTGSQELRAVVNELADALDEAEAENLGGTLTADADGRAKIDTDFFNAATVLLKFADASFAADTATRALFADGIWTAAKLASDAVTGPKLDPTAQRFLAFTGHNNTGACTATGLKVGDKVIGVVNLTDGTTATSSFEATVTVADQLQQSSASDLSSKKFSLLVVAKS